MRRTMPWSRRGRNLDAVGVAVLVLEHSCQVDLRRVGDADGDASIRACAKRDSNHEAQRKRARHLSVRNVPPKSPHSTETTFGR